MSWPDALRAANELSTVSTGQLNLCGATHSFSPRGSMLYIHIYYSLSIHRTGLVNVMHYYVNFANAQWWENVLTNSNICRTHSKLSVGAIRFHANDFAHKMLSLIAFTVAICLSIGMFEKRFENIDVFVYLYIYVLFVFY